MVGTCVDETGREEGGREEMPLLQGVVTAKRVATAGEWPPRVHKTSLCCGRHQLKPQVPVRLKGIVEPRRCRRTACSRALEDGDRERRGKRGTQRYGFSPGCLLAS